VARVVGPQEIKRHRFSVEEYHKMGEAGIFGEDDRVELIDGEVVEMTPIGWRHAWCVGMLNRLLSRWTLSGPDTSSFFVTVLDPISLSGRCEPQPDLALLRNPPTGHLPRPEEIALVVEVADTSIAFDRDVKLLRYAGAGIPEAWLADLNVDRFEGHSEPTPDGYRRTTRYARGERVESATLPGLAFDANEALPPKEPDAKEE